MLDQHAGWDFYGDGSLKQQSAGGRVAPIGHVVLIPSQPRGFIRPGLEPTIYRIRGEHANHYAPDAVKH